MTITPVGEYGAPFSRALLRTTQILMEIARQNLREDSARTFETNSSLLKAETARGKDATVEKTRPEFAALGSTLEGILSFHQFVTFMLGTKIPGVETGERALYELVFQGNSQFGLTSEFTAQVPMGLIGPLTLTGTYFKGPLVRGPNGKLSLSKNLTATFRKLMEIQVKRRRRGVCPMVSFFQGKVSAANSAAESARHEKDRVSGLQNIAEAFWHVFQVVNREQPQ